MTTSNDLGEYFQLVRFVIELENEALVRRSMRKENNASLATGLLIGSFFFAVATLVLGIFSLSLTHTYSSSPSLSLSLSFPNIHLVHLTYCVPETLWPYKRNGSRIVEPSGKLNPAES